MSQSIAKITSLMMVQSSSGSFTLIFFDAMRSGISQDYLPRLPD